MAGLEGTGLYGLYRILLHWGNGMSNQELGSQDHVALKEILSNMLYDLYTHYVAVALPIGTISTALYESQSTLWPVSTFSTTQYEPYSTLCGCSSPLAQWCFAIASTPTLK